MSITSLFTVGPVCATSPRSDIVHHYLQVRAHSLTLASPLSAEDQCVQSMPDASPTKWHLAHTTWFFEAMVLGPHSRRYTPFDTRYFYLFNSYYETLGPRHPRPQRGLLTRPTLSEIHAYRAHVDTAMQQVIENCDDDMWTDIGPLVILGLHHEQQHQELILTDILHALSCNPLWPAYQPIQSPGLFNRPHAALELKWLETPGGIVRIGHDAESEPGFAFDNESPRHDVLLAPYQMATRLVTCGEYANFIADGGYREPRFWLSEGWAAVQSGGWQAPAYWVASEANGIAAQGWHVFGLHGLLPMDNADPVCQLSFYEAAAYAEWSGARLPTEFEWEAAVHRPGVAQALGYAWQWTRSSYDPYPGFRSRKGAVGEYNGKFMVGQLVLRGSSCATPSGHGRTTYRNFFPPAARWQFSGLRLAKDLGC
ncbi:MAG: ergothioneine biosynthesis protein EgtB [Paralcaligenes sp.]